MAYYSTILLAFALGGFVAFIVARFIEKVFDRLESVPLRLRLFIGFLILAISSGLIEVFASDAGLPVAMAFSLGFLLMISTYELLFPDGKIK